MASIYLFYPLISTQANLPLEASVVPMSFRMSCFLVEMPPDAVVLARRIDETKTRMISMSLIGSVVAGLEEPDL